MNGLQMLSSTVPILIKMQPFPTPIVYLHMLKFRDEKKIE